MTEISYFNSYIFYPTLLSSYTITMSSSQRVRYFLENAF